MLPGKTSKLQVARNRTVNRHRWVGREYQGALENSGEGTRHNGTVTSGEGTPSLGEETCSQSRRGSKIPGGCDCLLKTQHSANTKVDV